MNHHYRTMDKLEFNYIKNRLQEELDFLSRAYDILQRLHVSYWNARYTQTVVDLFENINATKAKLKEMAEVESEMKKEAK